MIYLKGRTTEKKRKKQRALSLVGSLPKWIGVRGKPGESQEQLTISRSPKWMATWTIFGCLPRWHQQQARLEAKSLGLESSTLILGVRIARGNLIHYTTTLVPCSSLPVGFKVSLFYCLRSSH